MEWFRIRHFGLAKRAAACDEAHNLNGEAHNLTTEAHNLTWRDEADLEDLVREEQEILNHKP